MTSPKAAALDIVPNWARLNDGMVRLVDYIPEDKLNWSPKPELWNFKGTLIHICGVRHGWVSGARSGDPQWQEIIREAQTKEGIQKHLQRSWDLVAGFLANPEELAATYDNDDGKVTGHWIAYHLLEHDIHHRADIFHYLALLGIEHPEVGTP